MIIAYTHSDLINAVNSIAYDKTIGFVPTMGALHKGHVSLINRAKSENDLAFCSIFVNPTQFNNPDDFEKYPRNLDNDLELLKSAGCDLVFTPKNIEEVYTKDYEKIDLDLNGLDKVMEGSFRPGHFKGVVNVVNQLFKLHNPDRAYFGQKDFQQLVIIRYMTKLLELKVEIIGCETLRESNGLAYSSRNERLTQKRRQEAGIIYESLKSIRKNYLKYSLGTAIENAERILQDADGFKLEYLSACDSNSLKPLNEWHDASDITICTAVYADEVRLIDNLSFTAT